MDLNNAILDVEATVLEDGAIRLKYLAISGYCGPEIRMSKKLAEETIAALRGALDNGEKS